MSILLLINTATAMKLDLISYLWPFFEGLMSLSEPFAQDTRVSLTQLYAIIRQQIAS
jgi:hypothetical protein